MLFVCLCLCVYMLCMLLLLPFGFVSFPLFMICLFVCFAVFFPLIHRCCYCCYFDYFCSWLSWLWWMHMKSSTLSSSWQNRTEVARVQEVAAWVRRRRRSRWYSRRSRWVGDQVRKVCTLAMLTMCTFCNICSSDHVRILIIYSLEFSVNCRGTRELKPKYKLQVWRRFCNAASSRLAGQLTKILGRINHSYNYIILN